MIYIAQDPGRLEELNSGNEELRLNGSKFSIQIETGIINTSTVTKRPSIIRVQPCLPKRQQVDLL